MLSGWTSTPIRSTGRSNSQRASITSKPLFMSVAESIVIFAPMSQFGCASACSGVAAASASALAFRKGPPEAVSQILRTPRERRDRRDTARSRRARSRAAGAARPERRASSSTSGPPVTSTSLFASATSRPSRSAATTGSRPTLPTSAPIRRSASWVAASSSPSRPHTTRSFGSPTASRTAAASSARATETSSGRNCLHCCTSRSTERPAASATTRELVREARRDVEGLGADRAGRAEHAEPLHDSVSRACTGVRPKRRSRCW